MRAPQGALPFAAVGLLITVGAAERPIPLDAQFLRDHAETRGFQLGRPTAIVVTPNGDAVLFLRAGPRSPQQGLFVFDTASARTRELLTVENLLGGSTEKLSPEEKARRERMRVTATGFTSFQLSKDGRQILAPLGGRLFLIDRATAAARGLALEGDAFDPKLSPDGRLVGFVRDHDLWVFDTTRNRERRVTRGGTELISHGEAEFVAAEEMERYTGWWWSPDSREILFQETDARGVELWYVTDPAHPELPPRAQFYPRPGKANVTVRLGIVSARGGSPRWVAWDAARYPYLARVDWHETGGLTVGVQTRDQHELTLLRVDPQTGRTTPLVVEGDEAWVNIDPHMPRWLEDGSGFLWTSEREGAWRLELRDRDGVLVRVVVPSTAGYQGLAHLDSAARSVVVMASTDSPQTQLYRVGIDGGTLEAATREAGIHSGAFARDSDVHVLTTATPSSLTKSVVRRGDGTVIGELPSVAEEPGFEPRAEIVEIGAEPRYFAELIRPRNFVPGTKYPVIVDVYGGPHANVVQASMASHLLPQWLSDQGFVVVSLDNRGTPRRGRIWERAIYKRFAEVPLDDQVAGLQALGARFPELDLRRVGIVGWSFGGYMSALAVLRRPDIFHAAVAGAPVTDWFDYDTHYTERYLGVPPGDDDPVYARNSLLQDAPNLSRPLLILHGTCDDNVFFRHSLKLASALFRAGKPFEILPLPGLTHMVPDPVITERRWSLTARFFRQHLAGRARP